MDSAIHPSYNRPPGELFIIYSVSLVFHHFLALKVNLTRDANLVSRGAPGNPKQKCESFSGSGGVIVINGTINGTTPDPLKHTSPYSYSGMWKSYGVVLINGINISLFYQASRILDLFACHACSAA